MNSVIVALFSEEIPFRLETVASVFHNILISNKIL